VGTEWWWWWSSTAASNNGHSKTQPPLGLTATDTSQSLRDVNDNGNDKITTINEKKMGFSALKYKYTYIYFFAFGVERVDPDFTDY
jgi:hypothetical protein